MPNKDAEGWTVATLKEYFSARLDSMDKAVSKAETAMSDRLSGMNELRGAMADQGKMMLTRAEYEGKHQALLEKLDALALRITTIESTQRGRSAGFGSIGTIISSLASLAAVVAVILSIWRH
jgi:hypothetical protein